MNIKLHSKKNKLGLATVSDCDGESCRKHQWWLRGDGYVCTTIKGRVVKMQDFILGPASSGYVWDHIDGDKCNNTRENLRLATRSQNAQNSKLRSDTVSGYKGVSKLPSGKFKARITINKSTINIGIFDTGEEAARAYDKSALEYFGAFANLNFK